jgi:bifunctional non-homologous end joining protein LigD
MLHRNFRTDGFVDPCAPIRAAEPPVGPGWVHEIKHDGYRLIVRRAGSLVRLFTRRGYDWTDRYPAIAEAALRLRAVSFTLDGEAVVCGPDGVAVFDALHRHGKVREAMLYAFDLLELNGRDFRPLSLGERKKALSKLLRRPPAGVSPCDHTDLAGEVVFQQVCKMGLEGIEATVGTLPVGAIEGLDQGQEPGQPSDDAGAGGAAVMGHQSGANAAQTE